MTDVNKFQINIWTQKQQKKSMLLLRHITTIRDRLYKLGFSKIKTEKYIFNALNISNKKNLKDLIRCLCKKMQDFDKAVDSLIEKVEEAMAQITQKFPAEADSEPHQHEDQSQRIQQIPTTTKIETFQQENAKKNEQVLRNKLHHDMNISISYSQRRKELIRNLLENREKYDRRRILALGRTGAEILAWM